MVADETVATEPNEGKVTSLVTEDDLSGISRFEAQALGVELIGLDVDANARASFILSLDQFTGSLKLTADDSEASLTDAELQGLTMDDVYATVGGVKMPSFGSATYYLDVESAFLSSLAHKNFF